MVKGEAQYIVQVLYRMSVSLSPTLDLQPTINVVVVACTVILVLEVASSRSFSANIRSGDTVCIVRAGVRTDFEARGSKVLEVSAVEVFVAG